MEALRICYNTEKDQSEVKEQIVNHISGKRPWARAELFWWRDVAYFHDGYEPRDGRLQVIDLSDSKCQGAETTTAGLAGQHFDGPDVSLLPHDIQGDELCLVCATEGF